jgi:hypothetical protein
MVNLGLDGSSERWLARRIGRRRFSPRLISECGTARPCMVAAQKWRETEEEELAVS